MSTEPEVIISADPVAQITCPACGAVFSGEGIAPFSSVMCASCEKEFSAPGSFGGFLLQECLGMGGMGGVFRARDLSLNRDVAVKVMQASLGSDPNFIETFRREAQSVAKLNHPNIAQIYAFGEEKGQPYLVMELVRGTSLSKMMEAGPVEPGVAVRIGEQIAQALKHASESDIVHGDVKPENILLDENKQAKLVDFGIAALSGAREGGNEVWGTPYYIAPEKVTRQKVDRRADMYSLGGTLFHALTGHPPFDGPDPIAVVRARLDKPAPQLKDLIPSIDSDLNAVVDRMLKLDPSQRYPTYDSLLADLGAVQKKLRPTAFEGKRFVIKGKRPSAVGTTTGPAVVNEPFVVEQKKKGLFLAKKKEGETELKSLSGAMADEIAAREGPVDEEEAARQRKITVIKYAVLGGVGFFLMIGIIVGIVLGVKSSQAKGAIAAVETRRMEQIQAAEGRIANVMTQARKIHEKVQSYAAMADEQTREVLAAAEKVTPDAYKIVLKPDIPARKGYEPPVEEKPETAPPPVAPITVTNTPAIAATNAPANAAPHVPANSATNAPASGPTNAPVATVTNNAPAVAPAATNPPPAVADSAVKPAEEPAGAALPENTPPGLLMVRELLLQTAHLNGTAKDAQAWLAWLELASVSAGELRNNLEKMNALAEKMILEYNRFTSEKDVLTSKSQADQIRRAVLKCKGEIEALDRTFKAQSEAKLLAEKAGSAAEAKAKTDSEQQVLAKQETERVAAAEASAQDEISAFRLVSVRRQLNALGDELRTPAGKAACEDVQNKLRYIEALQNHLIAKLPGFSGIQSADNRRIVLEGGRDMRWDDIIAKYPQQMVRFIVAFVVEEKALAEYKATERGRIALGAAIYLDKSIKGSAAVDKIARELVERTLRKVPAMEDEVRRLAASVLQGGEAAPGK